MRHIVLYLICILLYHFYDICRYLFCISLSSVSFGICVPLNLNDFHPFSRQKSTSCCWWGCDRTKFALNKISPLTKSTFVRSRKTFSFPLGLSFNVEWDRVFPCGCPMENSHQHQMDKQWSWAHKFSSICVAYKRKWGFVMTSYAPFDTNSSICHTINPPIPGSSTRITPWAGAHLVQWKMLIRYWKVAYVERLMNV